MTQPKPVPRPTVPSALGKIIKGERNALDQDGCSVCIYGESGSGKTTALGTYPEGTGNLVIYTERNKKSLRRIGCDFLTPANWGEFLMALDEITDQMRRNMFPYSALSWDSISASEPMIIAGIAKKEVAVLKDWPLIKARVRDAMLRMVEFTNAEVYQTPIDVIITAGETANIAEGSGEKIVGPDVPGRALAPILFRLVDCVFHAEVRQIVDQQTRTMESKFVWLTQTEAPYTAKDGTDVMDKISEPSFTVLHERLRARAKQSA